MFESFMHEMPLPADCRLRYDCMAFNGCNYFFTVCGKCEIVEYDSEFCQKKCIHTCREYNFICYDSNDKCYWATSGNDCCKIIYKLSKNFQEIDYIRLSSLTCCEGAISGISFDCLNDAILVAVCEHIIKICKCDKKTYVLCTIKNSKITGIMSLAPGYIITFLKNKKQHISIYSGDNELVKEYCLFEDYSIKNIIFNPCKHCTNNIPLYIYATKKCTYPYILKLTLFACELGYIPSKCNYKICDEKCDEKRRSKDACADVMESVALVEAALSHILNAEGEKLQKVLASTCDVDKILCVNNQINKTIINATHLEHALYAKLDTLCNCCDICDDENSCCCDSECGDSDCMQLISQFKSNNC